MASSELQRKKNGVNGLIPLCPDNPSDCSIVVQSWHCKLSLLALLCSLLGRIFSIGPAFPIVSLSYRRPEGCRRIEGDRLRIADSTKLKSSFEM